MKKVYILLMHTNTIPSKMIKTVTHYRYSHVGLALDTNCNIIYSFGRKKFNTILDSGFSIEYKEGAFFKKFNKTICKIYEIDVTEEQYEKARNIIENMKKNVNKYRYDFLGLIPRFFGIPITFKNKYVCSYFVASVLEKSQIYNFNKEVCLIKPQDFENLKGFRQIYKGKYILYNTKKLATV